MNEARRRGEERRGAVRALAAEVPRIAGLALGKYGFGEAQLVTQWDAVMGSELAEKLAPDRLSFPRGERRGGTLRLRVAAGFALEAQHMEPLLIERINGFFGYAAVARIMLVQGPIAPKPRPAPAVRPLASSEQEALERRLAPIADPGLRAALGRLGAAVIGSRRS